LAQYLIEKVQAKTGLSTRVFIGYAAQAVLGIGSTILFFVALFFIFSDYLGFGGTTTSIGMFLLFVLLLVGAMLWTSRTKKKTIDDAERALEGRSLMGVNAPILTVGMQMGQKVGWHRAVPAMLALAAVTGVGAEWTRRHHQHRDHQD
jgi:Zn-dependent protease with chaperone function